MILIYFVLGFLLALGIARYNQSNKLFWTLFMSFVLGIAGGSIYQKLTTSMSIRNVHKEAMESILMMSEGEELPKNKSKPQNPIVCLHISILADNSA